MGPGSKNHPRIGAERNPMHPRKLQLPAPIASLPAADLVRSSRDGISYWRECRSRLGPREGKMFIGGRQALRLVPPSDEVHLYGGGEIITCAVLKSKRQLQYQSLGYGVQCRSAVPYLYKYIISFRSELWNWICSGVTCDSEM